MAPEAMAEPVLETPPESREPETLDAAAPSLPVESSMTSFLTAEESSVFAEETVAQEPRIFGESSVFAPEDEPEEAATDDPQTVDPGNAIDPSHSHDPDQQPD